MYACALKIAQGKFEGTVEERNGKLAFKGKVATEAEKNEIWDAIKTIPTWRNDIVADIQVASGLKAQSKPAPSEVPVAAKTYTVRDGDTLSGIAKEYIGSAGAYMKIFELNREQLSDPDRITPGQLLRLP